MAQLLVSVASFIGITFLGWKQYVYLEKTCHKTIDEQGIKAQAMTAILNSKYEKNVSGINPYIERTKVESQVKMLLYDVEEDPSFIATKIVCGPRGCGKSMLIAHILKDESAVVPVFFKGKDDNDFAMAVFQSLKITLPTNSDAVTFLRDVLSSLPKRPIFLVEVDKRFASESLEELLLLMKHLGDDSKLVEPIVVLSSSRSALGLHITPIALRSDFIEMTDLTLEQSRQFFDLLLTKMAITENERKQGVDFAVENIGTRLVHLHAVARLSKKCTSLEDFQSVVTAIYVTQKVCVELAFDRFKNRFPRVGNIDILRKLTDGMTLKELCEDLNIPTLEFIRVNSQIEPHIFYISPMSSTVVPESYFVRRHLENEIAKLEIAELERAKLEIAELERANRRAGGNLVISIIII